MFAPTGTLLFSLISRLNVWYKFGLASGRAYEEEPAMDNSAGTIRQLLANAARDVTPSCAGMFGEVRESSARERIVKTNPTRSPRVSGVARPSGARAGSSGGGGGGGGGTNPNEPISGAREGSGIFGDVRQCSAPPARGGCETNPIAAGTDPAAELSNRQLAAAQLLALGRTGRQAAGEVGVEEHTITRWRRMPLFAAEVRHQRQAAFQLRVAGRAAGR